ncbi:hypothetical protein HDU93_005449, partial [Gonapodya sp. JEL0774]
MALTVAHLLGSTLPTPPASTVAGDLDETRTFDETDNRSTATRSPSPGIMLEMRRLSLDFGVNDLGLETPVERGRTARRHSFFERQNDPVGT